MCLLRRQGKAGVPELREDLPGLRGSLWVEEHGREPHG